MELKEEDLVLCTVKSIEGTNINVEIEGFGPGSLVMSEVAAGRIRNIRDYVFPNKKIVCKVLKIINNNPHLSLRRVTDKEKQQVLDKYKKEQNIVSMFKTNVKNYDSVLNKIKEKYDLSDFFDLIKENSNELKKFISAEEMQKIEKILSKNTKQKEATKKFILKSDSDVGINDIKEILSQYESEISYLGSSTFSLTTKGKDFKEAANKLQLGLNKIESNAKSKKMFFDLKDK